MKSKGITHEILKLIACTAMLLDHIGAVFGSGFGLRIIGRMAYPIYCYLLLEGFMHSRNRNKYGIRLLLGMLLAELPFDYLFFGGFTWQHQSVMVTLFIGYVMIIWSRKRGHVLLPFCVCFFAAELIHADYGGMGIAVIAAFMATAGKSRERLLQAAMLSLVFWIMESTPVPVLGMKVPIQMFGLLALIPISLYSGEKHTYNKCIQWAFYLFYPVHMIVLLLVKYL